MSHPIAQPLRPLTELERQELQRVSRAPSETVSAISEPWPCWQLQMGKPSLSRPSRWLESP